MKRWQLSLCAFALPLVCFVIFLALGSQYPFGNNTLLTFDMQQQYISFLAYFRSCLTDLSAFLFSFTKGIGEEMVGLTAYYLLSPFNFISLLFSTADLPIAIVIIIGLKIACMGLSFSISLEDKSPSTLLFSSAYAFIGFLAAYYTNISWLDVLILLPLILLGIRHIVLKQKPLLYVICLSISLIINYYIAYGVCIFCVIYFSYELVCAKDKYLKPIIYFFLGSLLAGGIAAAILIPAYYSLQGTKDLAIMAFSFAPNFSFFDFMSKLYIGSIDSEQIKQGLPNIYTSLVLLPGVCAYFSANKISLRNKIVSIIVILILFFSFQIDAINLVWHGFASPNWYPYRYSYLFSVFLLWLSYNGFKNKTSIQIKQYLIYAVLLVCLVGCGLLSNNPFLTNTNIIITFVLLVIGIISIILLKRKFQIILLVLVMAESIFNIYIGSATFNFLDLSTYQNSITQFEELIATAKNNDNDFYRLEKTTAFNQDDAMLFNYYGITHNSSSEKTSIREYLKMNLGFSGTDNWAGYSDGSSFANNSLLGIKYLISDMNLDNEYYSILDTNGDLKLYQNNYALKLGFVADEQCLTSSLSALAYYDNQNTIWSSITGNNETIMKMIDNSSITTNNLNLIDEQNKQYATDGNNPYIEYQFKMPEEGPLYCYTGSFDETPMTYVVNGKQIAEAFVAGNNGINYLGYFNKEQDITFRIVPSGDTLMVNYVSLFYQDMNVTKNDVNILNKQAMNITSFKQNEIQGTIDVQSDNSVLMFTIPYDEQWTVYVDGQEVNSEKALAFFLAVKINQGSHDIKLVHTCEGLKIGMIISAISIALLLLWLFIDHQRNKHNESDIQEEYLDEVLADKG